MEKFVFKKIRLIFSFLKFSKVAAFTIWPKFDYVTLFFRTSCSLDSTLSNNCLIFSPLSPPIKCRQKFKFSIAFLSVLWFLFFTGLLTERIWPGHWYRGMITLRSLIDGGVENFVLYKIQILVKTTNKVKSNRQFLK